MIHAKSFLLTGALCLFSAILATAAEPISPGELKQSLNGTWQFTVDPALAAGNGEGWDQLKVPGNWDIQPQYSTYIGKGWYRLNFTVPEEWRGKQLRLRFEAVYQQAGVELNGKNLGGHVGGYTPFEFDVTDKVNYGGKNTLLVSADNSYRRGAWWAWGGISRSVNLIANNDARIVWQHIRTEPDLAAGSAKILVQYKLVNKGTKPLEVSLSSRIVQTALPAMESKVTLAPQSETLVEASAELVKADVRLWNFDHPNLYTFESQLSEQGKVLHGKTDRFGIRKIEVTGQGLFLNGEQVRVPGFNRVSDSNQFGNTEPDELVKQDVDLMKSAGGIMARLMHTPQAPNLLDYLDEKGMMIFAEIPVWGGNDPQIRADNPLTKQWLREMVERDYNHPCIIGWSPGNELAGHYNYVATMNEYIRKELDPHRLVAYISNTAAQTNYGPKNDPVTVSDIAMINSYGTKYFDSTAATLRSKWPDKPVFFSEYGVHQIGAKLDARIPDLNSIWDQIAKNPYVIGGSLWTFNDYRSHFKDTPASGNREWGVVTVDRQLKAAYWQIRKAYSPVHSLSVAGGVVSIQPRTRSEIPSYALRGYQIAWTLTDAGGVEKAKGLITVPDLKPDAPVWSSPIPGAKEAAGVSVSLMTPTGYAVDDAKSTGQGQN